MINGIEKKNISVKELKKDGRYLNAALYPPKTEPGKTYPLVLFLHGAGERGDDLNLVLDFTAGADTFMTDAVAGGAPELCPRCRSARKNSAGCRMLIYWRNRCSRWRRSTRWTSAACT